MNHFIRNKDYLYIIQPDPFHYYTGITSDSFQALAVLYLPSVVTVIFEKDGNLFDASEKTLPKSTVVIAEKYGFFEAYLEGGDKVIISHLQERGFIQGPIKVRRFFLPQYHIGIQDFPESFQDILLHPSSYSINEKSMAEEELIRWERDGWFELWLNPDSYRWIDRTGQVIAS